MACPLCGKPYPCAHENARVAVLVDPELADDSEQRFALSLQRPASQATDGAVEHAWRQEVASRVQQHRARRRRKGDSDASLSLDFPDDKAFLRTTLPAPAIVVRPETPKIIQFPRLFTPPPQQPLVTVPEDLELAAPVIESPRILYAPEAEQLDLLSSFADIELEAEQPKRPDAMDFPPQPAALMPRLFSGLVDSGIVLGATILFAGIFLVFAGLPRKAPVALLCALLAGSLLWLVFQCLFLVYGQFTPGMRIAELELCTFAGEPVAFLPRAYRALASTLSAVSLGLGFAWALFDEDRLGWHDRMTQTHLRKALSNQQSAFSPLTSSR